MWECFVLTDHILSGTSCRFYLDMDCKINFTAKNGSDLCKFYSKTDFWKYVIEIILCISSLI